MIILRRLGPLFCSLKRVHAGIFMLACPHFNEENKRPNTLSHDLSWENRMYKPKRSIRTKSFETEMMRDCPLVVIESVHMFHFV